MKKLLIGVLVFSFNVTAFSKEGKVDGFREIKWGESITRYKDIFRLTSDSNNPKRFYVRNNDEMLFGEISLTSIIYVFYKNKFSSVIIQTDRSAINLTQTFIELKKKLGKPYYKNKYNKKYLWKNEKTMVSLKCYASSHKCIINYISVAMDKLVKNN